MTSWLGLAFSVSCWQWLTDSSQIRYYSGKKSRSENQGLKTEVCKVLGVLGAALISAGGFLAIIVWGDFWMHDCYGIGGCNGSSLRDVGIMVAPFGLMSLVGFTLVLVGLRGLTGVTRTRYVVWSMLVGFTVLMCLYIYFLTPHSVPPP